MKTLKLIAVVAVVALSAAFSSAVSAKENETKEAKETKVEVPVQKETPKFSFEPIYRKPEPMNLKAEMEKLGLRKRKN
jgi:hypothetical protein